MTRITYKPTGDIHYANGPCGVFPAFDTPGDAVWGDWAKCDVNGHFVRVLALATCPACLAWRALMSGDQYHG
jgi:hypothetical protein